MANIEYSNSPNVDTAFVVRDDGKKNRTLLVAPQDTSTLEYPENPNSTKGYVTVGGKKHRVVLVADVVGGGGGGVDENRVIVKSATIPEASADELGKFYCYSGTTNANYTHGYVYECVKSGETYTGTVSFEPATLSGTTVTCSGDDFAAFVATGSATPTEVVSGTMTYNYASSIWVLSGLDSNGNEIAHRQIYQSDYEDYGFTFTGTPVDGDVVTFTCSVEESGGIYTWARINLQPGSEHDLGFFDTVAELQAAHPTGNAGDFALIGATDTFWVWDTTTNAWIDSHKADAVTSVNGQTGAVTLGINDVAPTQTGFSGYVLGTDGFVAGWVEPTTITFRVWEAQE